MIWASGTAPADVLAHCQEVERLADPSESFGGVCELLQLLPGECRTLVGDVLTDQRQPRAHRQAGLRGTGVDGIEARVRQPGLDQPIANLETPPPGAATSPRRPGTARVPRAATPPTARCHGRLSGRHTRRTRVGHDRGVEVRAGLVHVLQSAAPPRHSSSTSMTCALTCSVVLLPHRTGRSYAGSTRTDARPAVAGHQHRQRMEHPLSNTTAVAKAVARHVEQRAKAALNDVTSAHAELVAADAAVVESRDRRAAAGPTLSRAIDAALALGITGDQLTDLGITVPAARTRRRAVALERNCSPAASDLAETPDSDDGDSR